MKIMLLTEAQRYDVYYNHMMHDFHPTELKPYDRIEWLVKQGFYDCYGLFQSDGSTLMGYAYIGKIHVGEDAILILDYYAIYPDQRASGVGSKFIELIRQHFTGQFVGLIAEVENPDYGEDEENRQLRVRRLSFYRKNGFIFSKVLSRILVDEYRIIQLPFTKTLTAMEIEQAIRIAYNRLFTQEFYEKEIFVRMDETQ